MNFSEHLVLVAVRVVGLFMAYGTLVKFNMHPLLYVSVLAAMESMIAFSISRITVTANVKMKTATNIFLSLANGFWEAFELCLAFVALGKLHPLRVVILEQLIHLASVRQRLHLSLPLAAVGVVLMFWANNLTKTHAHSSSLREKISQEDLIHVMDNIGGMIVVVAVCVSKVARENVFRDPCDMSMIGIRRASTVVFSLIGFMLTSQNSLSRDWAGMCIESIVDAVPLVIIPLLYAAYRSKKSFVTLCPTGKGGYETYSVICSALVGFLLHSLYHRHYRNGNEIDEMLNAHPVFHVDNVVVVIGSLFVCGSFATGIPRVVHHEPDESSFRDFDTITELFESASRTTFSHALHSILYRTRQRRMLMFLCLTFVFMVVELVYGVSANSLSLVSDSFHMLLDSASIALSLATSIMSAWRVTDRHPYGYSGYEALSGFVNGLLLVLVAVVLLIECVARVIFPAAVDSEHLLFVAVGGLLINAIGLAFFHDAHHGHSHGDHQCHSHDHNDSAAANNMRSVYLHVLADLLGSVAVIISIIIVDATGWTLVDPICSAIISCFILMSAVPLIRDSAQLLMLRPPPSTITQLSTLCEYIRGMPSVERIVEARVWTLGGSVNVVAIGVAVKSSYCASCRDIRNEIKRVAVAARLCHTGNITVELT